MVGGCHGSPLRLTDDGKYQSRVLTVFDVAYGPLRLTNEFKPRSGWQTLNTTIAVPYLPTTYTLTSLHNSWAGNRDIRRWSVSMESAVDWSSIIHNQIVLASPFERAENVVPLVDIPVKRVLQMYVLYLCKRRHFRAVKTCSPFPEKLVAGRCASRYLYVSIKL